jgi:hypothetical protein
MPSVKINWAPAAIGKSWRLFSALASPWPGGGFDNIKKYFSEANANADRANQWAQSEAFERDRAIYPRTCRDCRCAPLGEKRTIATKVM